MATGLKVYTNGGSVLTIDSSYENLSLYSSGSAQTSAGDPATSYGLYTLTLTLPSAAIPQLALRTHDPSKYIGMVGCAINGNSYTFLLRTQGGPVAFDWYVFSIPQFVAQSTVGLKVWRPSDNRLVFDSGMKWMRVAGQVIGNPASAQVDPSRTYAIALAAPAMNQSRSWQNQPELPAQVDQVTNIVGARILNGVFSTTDMRVEVSQSTPGTPVDIGYISNGVAAYLALDITGF